MNLLLFQIALLIYNLLIYLTFPFVLLYLGVKRKIYLDREYLFQRIGRYPTVGAKVIFWIHAVSMGEGRAAAPLLKTLLQTFSPSSLLVTTSTPSGKKTLSALFPELSVIYSPIDLFPCPLLFLKHYRPRILLLVETEFWPNLIVFSKAYGVKIFLVNGRVSDRTLGARNPWRFLLHQLLHHFTLFLMRSEEDARRILSLGADPQKVRIAGDMKYEVPLDGVEEKVERLFSSYPFLKGKKIITAGSTHPGEEGILLQAFQEVRRRFPESVLILAPRHPERAPEILSLAHTTGFRILQRSAQPSYPSEEGENSFPPILLLDTVGELLSAYALADVCVVGGSFIPRGGHNPMEPASFKKPVLFGPSMENFRDSASLLLNEGGARRIQSASGLSTTLLTLLSQPETLQEMGERAFRAISRCQGASRRILQELQAHLSGAVDESRIF